MKDWRDASKDQIVMDVNDMLAALFVEEADKPKPDTMLVPGEGWFAVCEYLRIQDLPIDRRRKKREYRKAMARYKAQRRIRYKTAPRSPGGQKPGD